MPGNPLTDPDWASDFADTVERVVATVRDKTTRPLVNITRYIVFGLMALFLGAVAIVLLVVILTRGLQSILDAVVDHEQSVWISYLGIGGIFSLTGLLVLRKRHAKDS